VLFYQSYSSEANLMSKAARGFTLIELVVVIVILGILAAFAVPRFMGLEGQARAASVQALGGSLRSAASLARSVSMASGLAGNASITVDGVAVTMVNGYPTAADIQRTLQDITGFAPATAAGVTTFTRVGASTPGDCNVTYAESTGAGLAPVINVDVADCN
jgi:MSHA pilin protein MshA